MDDVVEALLMAAAHEEANGQIFNLGDDHPIRLLDLARLLIEINGGGRFEIVHFPPDRKAIDIGDYYGSFQKIAGLLGWRPKTRLREGLSRTLNYYREHRAHYWDNG